MITSGFDNQECKLDCAWAVFPFRITVQQITNHFKWLLIGQKWIAFFECGQIGNKIDQIKSWLVVCSSHGSTRQAINVTDCPPNCHNSIKIPKRTLFFKNVAFFQKSRILEKVSWSISIPSTYEFWARVRVTWLWSFLTFSCHIWGQKWVKCASIGSFWIWKAWRHHYFSSEDQFNSWALLPQFFLHLTLGCYS